MEDQMKLKELEERLINVQTDLYKALKEKQEIINDFQNFIDDINSSNQQIEKQQHLLGIYTSRNTSDNISKITKMTFEEEINFKVAMKTIKFKEEEIRILREKNDELRFELISKDEKNNLLQLEKHSLEERIEVLMSEKESSDIVDQLENVGEDTILDENE